MTTSNSFIKVNNIPNFLSILEAENGLRSILNRQSERFGTPSLIRIFQSQNDSSHLTAFVFYLNSDLNESVVRFFDYTNAFGTNLNFIIVNRRYAHPADILRSLNLDQSERPNLIPIVATHESTNGNEANLSSTETGDGNATNVVHSIINLDTTESVSTQSSDSFTTVPLNNASQSFVRIPSENISLFRCNRCEHNFGNNQECFEDHVEQCKEKEEESFSCTIRNSICRLCFGRFLQTPVTSMHILSYCGHVFHKECFLATKAGKKNCPYCNEIILDDSKGAFYL